MGFLKKIFKTKKEVENYNYMLDNIVNCIEKSKVKMFVKVNEMLLKTYWKIGEELNKSSKYGKGVVEKLSEDLKKKYPENKGYSVRNLWNMKKFYEEYQKLKPVVAEFIFKISWANHLSILNKTKTIEEKEFYIKMNIKERWSKRELERQIDSSLFERYITADKPKKVLNLIPENKILDLNKHLKDEYVLEFLDLKKEYSEKELERAILSNLRDFFLEFGKKFAFIGSQYVVDVGGRENRIDLLFYHRELKCLVAIDLKIGEFRASHVGQMQKYLSALDEKVKLPEEKESIGLILCKSKNHEEVKFALAKTLSPMKVATYKTMLPDKKLIEERLKQINFNKRGDD
jgi:predicted nuclease of restriction endonuclease-like (RecB) superfamily